MQTMNGAPDWQDGECCFRCRTQFTLVARKHHCRNCGNIFCAKCSSQQIPLPKLSIDKPVRVCDGCYDKLASKKDDPLALALDKTNDNEPTKKRSSSISGSSSSKSTTSNKPPANASAPSEQELKEEEELQLALALSLSETPAKISFPDCRQFEDPVPPAAPSVSGISIGNNSNHYDKTATYSNNVTPNQQSTSLSQPVVVNNAGLDLNQPVQIAPSVEKQQPALNQIQPQYSLENNVSDNDQELFRFVAEVQSTSEVFTNRVNSSKLRNRPIANDSAIQGLFLKLTTMHTKLLEYIKVHEDERSGYEALQDKLSQITDARAALDALREEHQEKIRQEAAEAERQRQSQLALKLELMRQKKSQMMQYQREVALQRIQAQEMMLRQPQAYSSTSPTNNMSQQGMPQQAMVQQASTQQIPTQQVLPPPPPPPQQQPQQLQQQFVPPPPPPNYPITDINQPQHQQPPMPKQEDEALLISFDD